MEAALLSFLMWMNQVQGIANVPATVPSEWVSANTWVDQDGQFVFQAQSSALIEECRKSPNGFIAFPVVLYGAHEIFLDGAKIVQFGNPSMTRSNYVVSAPIVDCHSVVKAESIVWKATAYSKYYAHVAKFPSISNQRPATRLFGETLYIGSVIGLAVLAMFSLSVLYGKESNQLMFALCTAMLLNAVYQLMLIAPAFDLGLTMRTAHRIGDISLGLGFFCVIWCFWIEQLIPRWLLGTHAIMTILALPFWLLGTTGDTIQFGTSLPMPTVLIGFTIAAYRLAVDFWHTRSAESAAIFLFSLIFVGVIANDISVFTGSASGYTYMSCGILSAFLIMLFAVNQRISATYVERAYLRANLETEVERKTFELQSKTAELESAMSDLKHTQAELIQSAKLASLGTLSAGIAHEINNSINFVNGAIPPLEKLIAKLEFVSARDHEIGRKLLSAIKDGISITVEIVKSLRQFTGLNQAKFKDVAFSEVIHSVSTILNSRLKESYTLTADVPEELTIYGDVVGINQILMNLITNALDAMPSGGSITVRGTRVHRATVIEIQDTGPGIPENIRERIFDPFFTTKEVGEGTGLGLYIIANELKKYKGKIEVQSQIGVGTTFRLTFPDPETAELGAVA